MQYSIYETDCVYYFLLVLCLQFLSRQFMSDIQFDETADNGGGLIPVRQMVHLLKVKHYEL